MKKKAVSKILALKAAVAAASEAGALMRKHLNRPKRINEAYQHDIKLELDVRCQKLIERKLRKQFPEISILGEEGNAGDENVEARWVVDPIDGTVNFTYGIPHACVSIALQIKNSKARYGYETVAGVVYDPFADEMFTAIAGKPARLNGRRIRVSSRKQLEEAIISIGFAKTEASLQQMLPRFNALVHRVRKIRIMGAAALAIVYVACGRFDGYVEGGLRLWDIAAGGLILESAGGDFWHELLPKGEPHSYRLIANNGKLRRSLAV
ncbi:MAG: inositol monophosphatase family protein [Verrucomicrobiota bacterium]|nr:inositol monophosphatase family protein [Verrucomicrobiota bacterium]